VGCGHARTVEPAVPPAEAKKEEKKDAKKADAKKDEKKDEKDAKADAKAEGKPDDDSESEAAPKKTAATFTSHHATNSDDSKEEDGAVRLSTSPAALLKPGALKTIQEKLVHAGDLEGEPNGQMDAATQKALVKFQRHHDLPATGVPDDATVGRLGLKPAEVFR
jgi:peptidoglycan hydrolase-like protein with peptidoglycan-binding domain